MRFALFGLVGLTLAAPLAAVPSQTPAAKTPTKNQSTIQKHWAIQKHWECVPIARALSGIQIFGDARTWWGQADGRYDRGRTPKKGAVLSFRPHGSMTLGHVAAVSKVVDQRTILVTHSNWSPINGRRGQIERDVKVIDVSDKNDWSRVRVWYAPTQDLGGTQWPVHGFIYPESKAPLRIPTNAVYANGATKKTEPAAGAKTKAVASASKKAAEPIRKAAARPTGKLDYMAGVLAKIEKAERKR